MPDPIIKEPETELVIGDRLAFCGGEKRQSQVPRGAIRQLTLGPSSGRLGKMTENEGINLKRAIIGRTVENQPENPALAEPGTPDQVNDVFGGENGALG